MNTEFKVSHSPYINISLIAPVTNSSGFILKSLHNKNHTFKQIIFTINPLDQIYAHPRGVSQNISNIKDTLRKLGMSSR
jgi:hypothetical protein